MWQGDLLRNYLLLCFLWKVIKKRWKEIFHFPGEASRAACSEKRCNRVAFSRISLMAWLGSWTGELHMTPGNTYLRVQLMAGGELEPAEWRVGHLWTPLRWQLFCNHRFLNLDLSMVPSIWYLLSKYCCTSCGIEPKHCMAILEAMEPLFRNFSMVLKHFWTTFPKSPIDEITNPYKKTRACTYWEQIVFLCSREIKPKERPNWPYKK